MCKTADKNTRGCAAARLAAWAATTFAGIVAVLAGCTGDPPPRNTSAALAGGWQMLAGGCTQGLALQDNGEFALGVRLAVAGLTWRGQATGNYQGPGYIGGDEPALVHFVPTAAESHPTRAYCAGWAGAQQTTLPLAPLLAQIALSPDALVLQSEFDPMLGTLLLGIDATRTARLAATRDTDGALKVWLLDDAFPGQPLYHARGGDPSRALSAGTGIIVDLPDQVYRTPGALPPDNALEFRVLLNIGTATRISFSAIPGTGTAACKFVLYTSDDFLTASGVALPQTGSLDANPLAGDLPYYRPLGSGGGSLPDAYVLRVGVHSLADADCTGRIAGHPLVGALLQDAMTDGLSPAATLAPPLGESFWAGAVPAAAQTLALLPLGEDALSAAGLRPTGTLLTFVEGTASEVDPLGLGISAGRPLLARIQLGQGQSSIALTPAAEGGPGLGPLWPYGDFGVTGGTAWPGSLGGTFAAGEVVHVREVVTTDASPLRVTADGTLALAAELVDARGRVWATADADPQGGAGFEMVVAAPAGQYRLLLRSGGTGGSYTVSAATEPAGGVSDAALRQCLLDNARAQGGGPLLRELACAQRDIAALDGLESYVSLLRADFSGNAISNLQPLAALGSLRVLSLDGNAVTDATPLLALGRLHRLSLAHNPLDAATLAALGTFSTALSVLNLRGVSALSENNAVALKAALPETLVITPGGQVLR